jgi:hypothetical protein
MEKGGREKETEGKEINKTRKNDERRRIKKTEEETEKILLNICLFHVSLIRFRISGRGIK